MYTTENGSSYIDQVNEFLDNTENGTFTATTILVAQWIDVCSIDDYLCFEVITLCLKAYLSYGQGLNQRCIQHNLLVIWFISMVPHVV